MGVGEVFPGDDELHIHLTHALIQREDVDARVGQSPGRPGEESRDLHIAADDGDDGHGAGGNFRIGKRFGQFIQTAVDVFAPFGDIVGDGVGVGVFGDVADLVAGETLRISAGTNLYRAGYSLQKWNTRADGTGLDIMLGSYKVAEDSNLTLYAVWSQDNNHTITFDYNGAVKPAGASDADWIGSKTVEYNGSIGELPKPSISGHTFKGWYVYPEYEPSKYNDNDTYTVKGSVTLVAKWE